LLHCDKGLCIAYNSQENEMKIVLSIAAAAMFLANGADAMAAEMPTFEVTGFPISPVQAQLMGAANVREQSPVATLASGGMSASPHQISVLTPLAKRTAAAITPAVTTAGFVAR
jgi:hypothetical protein